MNDIFKKRTKSFVWRAGAFVALAILAYIANISDIRDIEYSKLFTIFITTLSAFVIGEITKYLNTQETEK